MAAGSVPGRARSPPNHLGAGADPHAGRNSGCRARQRTDRVCSSSRASSLPPMYPVAPVTSIRPPASTERNLGSPASTKGNFSCCLIACKGLLSNPESAQAAVPGDSQRSGTNPAPPTTGRPAGLPRRRTARDPRPGCRPPPGGSGAGESIGDRDPGPVHPQRDRGDSRP